MGHDLNPQNTFTIITVMLFPFSIYNGYNAYNLGKTSELSLPIQGEGQKEHAGKKRDARKVNIRRCAHKNDALAEARGDRVGRRGGGRKTCGGAQVFQHCVGNGRALDEVRQGVGRGVEGP